MQNSGGEKMQNREWRQVKENSLCTELTLDSTPPACMHLSPEPWGPVPGAAQTHGKEEEEVHVGDRGPSRAQPRPCPQEAVQGSLPHGVAAPTSPASGSSHTCATCTKTAAPRCAATHLSPALPPRADLTCWSFSAGVSAPAASPCHQLIHCAKQHLYIESCSHAG